MLPCIGPVIDHRGCQNVVRTSETHSGLSPRVPLFCSYHILTSSAIYYWTDVRQHEIYLLIIFSHFDWFSPMIYYRTDVRLTSSLQSFSLRLLKWRQVLKIWIIFYMIGQKISTKKHCRGIEQV